MLPTGGTCGLKPGWGSRSTCTGPGRWRDVENCEEAGEFRRGREGAGGGGAVTECQSNLWRLGCRDSDEEREKAREDGTRALPNSEWCGGLSTRRCGPPPVVAGTAAVVVGSSAASVVSSSVPAASLFPWSCSSSFLAASAPPATSPSRGADVTWSVPLRVWRACRLVRCRGREKGTLP